MRLNVYSQELITEHLHVQDDPEGAFLPGILELVTQLADTGVTYSAVRMYLHSPEQLHCHPGDDDRSAITFWLPKSVERREFLAARFEQMAKLIREAPPETGLD